mmetsp:Transcript_25302/g.22320  ORF Transcript_25302/g.22320 Transcript_25302/m.22320 type:complete len:147 (+) Transcript_25302:717-1157(+)|eukprot:CAMPEP_0114579034 /NCGR_PEP_ID=MMETSP0125-20121206/3492_1 /TAXON_ID=485358 ORGANISM="Aristerostoma sp., Strain ATCC 50986" /NCGR_SAMPLE_ID=MMETSP0125 /ASSEMBLY_ACC=CAM_ASM_000245 /LENGTH=146 /DNA_ID=CAMNT_0001769537 /DNA_START=673 /DNA_END=1113 /DNA_ORIENTATION=+
MKGDVRYRSKGTENYRSLELKMGKCSDPFASDIFSAGIVLFSLKTGGILPYDEDDCYENCNMYYMLTHDVKKFWHIHRRNHVGKKDFFNKEFRKLFESMVAADPKRRATIEQIKESEWYKGEVYTKDELVELLKDHIKEENELEKK